MTGNPSDEDDIWLSLDELVTARNQRLARMKAEQEKHRRQEEEEAARYRDRFLDYHLTAKDRHAIMRKIRTAFESGAPNLLLFRFPSSLCTDSGRAINNALANWPETLPGAAREVFEFWRDHLRERGFMLSASIVSFTDGRHARGRGNLLHMAQGCTAMSV